MNFVIRVLDKVRKNYRFSVATRLQAQELLIKWYSCSGYGFHEAHKIGSAITSSSMSLHFRESDSEYEPLPDLPLPRLLELSDGPHMTLVNPSGNMTYTCHVAHRGIAAAYTFENFGRSPEGVLEAMGYTLTQEEEW